MGDEKKTAEPDAPKRPLPHAVSWTALQEAEAAAVAARRGVAKSMPLPPPAAGVTVAKGKQPAGGASAGLSSQTGRTAEAVQGEASKTVPESSARAEVMRPTPAPGAADVDHARATQTAPTGTAPPPRDDNLHIEQPVDGQGAGANDPADAAAGNAVPPSTEPPLAGLALSGGGVRSATFCFGLLRGLAQNGLLRRFDYLSTVSGGGYIGAAFGRLVGQMGIGEAEAVLRSGDSLLLTWLRRNGRYLSPAGARDFGMAIATYLRAGVAVNFELGFLALLVGLCVIAPHLLLSACTLLEDQQWSPWQTAWWPIAACMWLLLGPGAMVAYWPLRTANGKSEQDPVHTVFARSDFAWLVGGAIVAALIAWKTSLPFFVSAPPEGLGLPPFQFFAALAATGAALYLGHLVFRLNERRLEPAADVLPSERNRLTRALRMANGFAAMLFALGLLDLVTRWLSQFQIGSWLAGSIGIGGAIAVLVRSFAEPLQKISVSPDGPKLRWLPQLINVAGILVGLALLCAWVVLLQWLVFDDAPWSAFKFVPPLLRAAVILVLVLMWFAFTGHNCEMVNASSLHTFYRSRLVRAYISIGNPKRFEGSVAQAVPARTIDAAVSVTDLKPDDDIALSHYKPELKGGPIHLVCSCLNQTRDDTSGLYNADRKGAAVVASHFGFEVGLDKVFASEEGAPTGTLGQWVAISGAAAAPGAGSNTTSGWALLLFLIGARLGYWLDAASVFVGASTPDKPGSPQRDGVLAGMLGRWRSSKPGLLSSEALASFGGSARPWWFLSDGGHFDNTGVYALLRREVDFIVLADCGADAQFEFADLENLIRKARIDFDAEIEFYTRDEAAEQYPLLGDDLCVLSPENLIDNHSARGVLLARICYRRNGGKPAKIGSLLVVKPNLHDSLDNDVLAYARRNPTFPQQSTGDQFFDEAQWESYHRLGEDFGRALDGEFLAGLPAWNAPVEIPAIVRPLRRPRLADAKKPDADAVPFWRRGVTATALGTTLGVGAIGTLLLPLWQSVDSIRQRNEAQTQRALKEKSDANELWLSVADAGNAAIAYLKCHGTAALQAAPTACASDATAHDVSTAESYKLSRVYATSKTYPSDDADLRNVIDFVTRAREACGSSGSTCDNVPDFAPRLCSAVCDSAVKGEKATYWSGGNVFDERIKANPVVGFVLAQWYRVLDWGSFARTAPVPPPAAAPPPVDPKIVADSESPRVHMPPTETTPVPVQPVPDDSAAFAQCLDEDGRPMTVYVQIYDETLRVPLQKFYAANAVAQVRVAGIENVTHTAAVKGAAPRSVWSTPMLLMHRSEPADVACAKAIAGRLQPVLQGRYATPDDALIGIRSLPASLKSRRHVIELWLPPGARAQGE